MYSLSPTSWCVCVCVCACVYVLCVCLCRYFIMNLLQMWEVILWLGLVD